MPSGGIEMPSLRRFILCLIIVTITVVPLSAIAADKGHFSTKPTTHDGKKWRIGYYEGGTYIDYQLIFAETVKALMKMGWIEEEPLPPLKGEETAGLWNWLTEHAKSEYLDFVKNAHYSAKWEDNERETTVNTIIKRLNTRKDIDLMIAMGTWAGKDLANASHTTDTMVVSASDAVSAGIIKSIEDSGFDYVHAYVDPYRYQRQVRVFHDMIGFKRLGVVYETRLMEEAMPRSTWSRKSPKSVVFKSNAVLPLATLPMRKKEKTHTLAVLNNCR